MITQKYRSKLELLHNVLKTISEHKPIISVVTRFANMSNSNAAKYLQFLHEKQCVYKIAAEGRGRYGSYEYPMTSKGLQLLKTIETFLENLGDMEIDF